ncbi:hypothetical protein Tco_0500768 [Tanacetum coccineum]
MDSILEDSVDKNSPDDNLVDTLSEMFTNEHALDFSSPPLWDDNDDELLDLKTVNDDTYDDPFDSKEEKIKDAKLLSDELEPPGSSNFLPFPSVTRFSMRIFPRLMLCLRPTTRTKSTKCFFISWDFIPPLYELPFTKKFRARSFTSYFRRNDEKKVIHPGFLILEEFILTSSGTISMGIYKLSKS